MVLLGDSHFAITSNLASLGQKHAGSGLRRDCFPEAAGPEILGAYLERACGRSPSENWDAIYSFGR